MATENNDEVMGAMMMDRAKKEYPYLADKDIAFTYSPKVKTKNQLESWPVGETGSPDYPRPANIPIDKFGMQVFKTQGGTPINMLGDYVSHHGVENDPKLKDMYQQFQASLDPAKMQERYAYHQNKLGEKRPYDQWYQSTGLPEMFRGYTFNQWGNPKQAAKMYTPEQLKILDQVRQYLNIK